MIESATWRCARWTSPGNVIFGNDRYLAFGEVFFTAGIGARLEALCHQETVRCNAQTGVVVKSPPAPSLIVTQSQILLQVLVIALNAPAHVRGAHQIVECACLWQCRQIVFLGRSLTCGPLNKQPLLG